MLLVTFREEILAEDEIEADKDMLVDLENLIQKYSDYQKRLSEQNQAIVYIDLIRKYRFKTIGDFENYLEKNITDKLDL